MIGSPGRPVLVRTALLVCAGAIGWAAQPTTALAATSIGQASPGTVACTGPNFTAVQAATTNPPGYSVPAGGGVVTTWTHQAAASGGTLQLKMLRPVGGNQYLVVGQSAVQAVVAGANAYTTQIPVRAGDRVALRSTGTACAFSTADAGDVILGSANPPSDPAPPGTTWTAPDPGIGVRLAIAAGVEADADGDGFGDESQDGCPSSRASQGACPAAATQPTLPAPQLSRPGLLPGACANARRGSARKDVLNGTRAGDRLSGLGGDDVVNGLAGNDCLTGGAGNDRLVGGPGADRLTGGPGADRIRGGSGRNKIAAGSGDDVIAAANGRRERVNCGPGRDRVRADAGDRLRGCERVRRAR